MTICEKIQAGLTVREVTFEEWDPDIVKEEEGVDGDNHEQTNLSAQELSKFALLPLPLLENILCITAYILYGCLVVLNAIKLARDLLTSRRLSFKIRLLDFWELFKFLICFVSSFTTMFLTFYFYTRNRSHCPLTFPRYQFRFCECDLLERDFHKFFNIPEYELNRLCVSRYEDLLKFNDVLYVDSSVQFSNYMQTTNHKKGNGNAFKKLIP